MWQLLTFKQFLPLKIQINSKKPGLWKEKSAEGVVNTWAILVPMIRHIWAISFHTEIFIYIKFKAPEY